MYSKISDLITTVSVLVFLAALLALANGCEKTDRFRGPSGGTVIQRSPVIVYDEKGNPIVNPDIDAIRSGKLAAYDAMGNRITDVSALASRSGGLSVTYPSGRVAYVLSRLEAGRANTQMQAAQGSAGNFPTRQPGQSYAQQAGSMGGSSGQIDVISVYDESDMARSGAATAEFRVRVLIQSNGIQGRPTRSFGVVTGISEDSYIDVLPHGRSLLVSRPYDSKISQFILDDTGYFLSQYEIDLCVNDGDPRARFSCPKPTRFVAMHDFDRYPFLFVATDQGITVLKFDRDHPSGIPVGRKFGAQQRVDFQRQVMPVVPSTGVYDIALSVDDSLAYIATANNYVYYKDVRDLLTQLDSGGAWQRTGYQTKRIVTPITQLQTMPVETVGVLTNSGIDFLNMANQPIHFQWGRLGSFRPLNLLFHPDGLSVLVLTETAIFRFPLTDGQIGQQADAIPLDSGIVDFAVDKRRGNFVAIAHRGLGLAGGRSNYSGSKGHASFARLDDFGIVSAPNERDKAPVSGYPISITVR